MRSYPRLVNGGGWRGVDLPWIVNGGSWHRVDNAWVVNGGVWQPLWDKIDLPQSFWNSTHEGGRSGSIGGVLWGNSVYSTYWDLPTAKRVVGVVIDITLDGYQGGWHGSGGKYGANQTRPGDWSWDAPSGSGVKRSPVLPCSFAAGERITVWAYGGGSDKGDGKNLRNITLVDVIYG